MVCNEGISSPSRRMKDGIDLNRSACDVKVPILKAPAPLPRNPVTPKPRIMTNADSLEC